jgi:hypothetical protein
VTTPAVRPGGGWWERFERLAEVGSERYAVA